jgi:hypothetical protein
MVRSLHALGTAVGSASSGVAYEVANLCFYLTGPGFASLAVSGIAGIDSMAKTRTPKTSRNTVEVAGHSPGKTAGEIATQANTVVSHSIAAVTLSPEERHLRVRLAAYRRAEARGFQPGNELEDWLAAEREVDEEIND